MHTAQPILVHIMLIGVLGAMLGHEIAVELGVEYSRTAYAVSVLSGLAGLLAAAGVFYAIAAAGNHLQGVRA